MEILLDPGDATFAADRYGAYRTIRATRPVARTLVNGVESWLLTRHVDVERVLKDPGCRVQPTVDGIPVHIGTGPAAEFYRHSLPCMDPPLHTRLRRLVTPAFAPRAVAAMREWLTELIEAGLRRLADSRGEIDFVAEFATVVPAQIACRLVHAPPEDAQLLLSHQLALNPVLSQGELSAAELSAADQAARFYFDYLGDVVDTLRGKVSAQDPVGALLAAPADELSRTEIVTTMIGFLIASYHTTMVSMTNAVHALLGDERQWAALAADPGLAGGAWEETLRHDAPVHFVWRYAGRDMEFSDGTEVAAGSHLLVGLAAANRDERRFERPEVFDIRRADGRGHLSFAAGGHFCLGAPLARLEGELLLERLPALLPGLRRSGDTETRYADLTFPFLTTLPVLVAG